MRNGNSSSLKVSWNSSGSSYPTYEEWKLSKSIFNLVCMFWFLSYLWGMETYRFKQYSQHCFRSYPTYEEWKPHFCFWYSRCSTYRSYPTYEEWKLPKTSFSFLKECSSYPTYEEWKLCTTKICVEPLDPVLILPMRNGNYRCIHLYKKLIKTIVLILPMRNGNLLKPSESQEIRNVLILPMRNGNRSYEENNYEKIVVLILPMRNGNIFLK